MSLQAKHISFSYGTHEVLHDVSVQFGKARLNAILGKNGSGKTTLFRCLLGLSAPSKGQILIDGKNLEELSAKQRATKLAYIPQAHNSVFNYEVLDVVLMSAQSNHNIFKTPKKADVKRAYEALDSLGIADLAHRGYQQISGGQRQLVLIARALVQNAQIIIMDEPTSALDYGNVVKVMSVAKQLAGQGYGIVLSTHQPALAKQYCDEVVFIKDGHIIDSGDSRKLITKDKLASLYDIDNLPFLDF